MFKLLREKRGITAIEVIIIIAILAVYIVLGGRWQRKQVLRNTCIQNQRNIRTAIRMWHRDHPDEKWKATKGAETHDVLVEYIEAQPSTVFDCPADGNEADEFKDKPEFKQDTDDYDTDDEGNVYCRIDHSHNIKE